MWRDGWRMSAACHPPDDRKGGINLAISREKKEAMVVEYTEMLNRSAALLVTEYRGLTVKQLEALRRELRAADSELMVSKNTLMELAMTQVGMTAPESLFTGPTAVTFCFGEVGPPAKTLTKWAKDTKILTLRGGMIGPSIFDQAGVQALSELPSKDQLRAQVVGTLQSPITGLVNVLAGPMRGLMTVLNGRIAQIEQPA
jgi:large subunit ribosomal protein L10